ACDRRQYSNLAGKSIPFRTQAALSLAATARVLGRARSARAGGTPRAWSNFLAPTGTEKRIMPLLESEPVRGRPYTPRLGDPRRSQKRAGTPRTPDVEDALAPALAASENSKATWA